MMHIARQTDYAARLVLHLASLGEGVSASIAEISGRRRLPVAFVRRMVSRLVAAGILRTARGAKGGVQLARAAASISLRDVVEAMEGPIGLNDCVHAPEGCPFGRDCPVRAAWVATSLALGDHLAGIDFHALAFGSKGHALGHAVLGGSGAARGGAARRHRGSLPSNRSHEHSSKRSDESLQKRSPTRACRRSGTRSEARSDMRSDTCSGMRPRTRP
jgi:Rrf2 family protein